jgi:hypothetical protein
MEIGLRKAIPDPEKWGQFTTPQSLMIAGAEPGSWLSLSLLSPQHDPGFKLFFLFFDYLGLRESFQIRNDRLFNFCWSLTTAYRSGEDLLRATRRSTFLCNSISKIGVSEIPAIQRFALLLATLAFDLGLIPDSPVARTSYVLLYGNGPWLQKHRCTLLLDIFASSDCSILDRAKAAEIWDIVVNLIQATYMGFYLDILKNKADNKRGLKLLAISTYLSDIVSVRMETEHKTALYHEFLETVDLQAFGIEVDGETTQEIQIAKMAFIPVLEEFVRVFPCLSILRPLIQVNLKSMTVTE